LPKKEPIEFNNEFSEIFQEIKKNLHIVIISLLIFVSLGILKSPLTEQQSKFLIEKNFDVCSMDNKVETLLSLFISLINSHHNKISFIESNEHDKSSYLFILELPKIEYGSWTTANSFDHQLFKEFIKETEKESFRIFKDSLVFQKKISKDLKNIKMQDSANFIKTLNDNLELLSAKSEALSNEISSKSLVHLYVESKEISQMATTLRSIVLYSSIGFFFAWFYIFFIKPKIATNIKNKISKQ